MTCGKRRRTDEPKITADYRQWQKDSQARARHYLGISPFRLPWTPLRRLVGAASAAADGRTINAGSANMPEFQRLSIWVILLRLHFCVAPEYYATEASAG
jgi:glucose-6-phosphate dehydrogenase assembly protein OpcA